MVFAVVSASHRAETLLITAISPFFHVFRYFLNCVGPLYMAIKFFAFFFSDNQYFRMFLVSMADIIGSYERLPNDAVRAVAVAKRRE